MLSLISFYKLNNMKKLVSILWIVLLFQLYSCEKGESCDKDTGNLEVHNTTDYKYNVYIDSVWFKTLDKFESAYYDLKPKNYQVVFEQVTGFDSIPYIYEQYVDVDACAYTSCNVIVYP